MDQKETGDPWSTRSPRELASSNTIILVTYFSEWGDQHSRFCRRGGFFHVWGNRALARANEAEKPRRRRFSGAVDIRWPFFHLALALISSTHTHRLV
jgi:hypothetical protein